MFERISAFIKLKNLSPSQFADEIGVQRSSISHLIAGRNKPSLEFIQKILARYQEINVQWLLTGNGPMTNDGTPQPELFPPADQVTREITNLHQPDKGKQKKQKPYTDEEKLIEKIIVFYRDKTFREYYPE